MRGLVLAALLTALAAAAGCGKKDQGGGGGDPEAAALEVTAQELVEAYRANTVAADGKFKEKRLRVKNVDVEKVGRSVEGNPVITSRQYIGSEVGGRFEQCRLLFGFPDKEDPSAARVLPGGGRTLEGVCRGKTLERPHGQDEIPQADRYIVIARTTTVPK